MLTVEGERWCDNLEAENEERAEKLHRHMVMANEPHLVEFYDDRTVVTPYKKE